MKKKLQVFISSTYKDLQTERQAAVAAVLKAGHIPAGMELFTAGDQSQLETIKLWIDESDVYMLILGGRYGSIESTSGISYTELEYDYAAQQGKPLFAVVAHESALEVKVKTLGMAGVETVNGAALQAFRSKALSNISSFYSDEKDIRLAVYESLLDFSANRDLPGWVPGDSMVDTKPIFDEISKLASENADLRRAIAELERKPAGAAVDHDFDELEKILTATQVKIPAAAIGGKKDSENDLFSLFYANRDTLMAGVTNQAGGNEANSFFYFNLFPKLQIHGLADNEKVPGAQYRRSFVTPKGRAFLARIEKANVAGRISTVAHSSDTPAAVPSDEAPVEEAVAQTARKKATRKPSAKSAAKQ